MLWSDYKHFKNIGSQMMMASTNVTGSYWFAIASGTSGCTNDGEILAEPKVHFFFVKSTFGELSQDMAQGQGEHPLAKG